MIELTECYADLMDTGVCFMKDGKRIDPAEVKLKYTEAELQEKLRQQREACAEAFNEYNGGSTTAQDNAILNAKIDD